MTLSVVRWVHTDPYGLVAAAERAATVAKESSWTDDAAGLAALRALLVSVCATAANAGSYPTTLDTSTETATILVKASENARNVRAQFALLNGLMGLICQRNVTYSQLVEMGNAGTRKTYITTGGEPEAAPTDIANPIVIGVGAAAVIGVAVVITAGVIAGAIGWMHASDNEVKALQLTTDLKAKEHAQTLTTTRDVIESHLEREATEKRSIPWTIQEMNYIEFLEQSTKEITGWEAPPLRSVPDLKQVSDAAATAVKDVGKSTGNAIEILPIVAGVALLYWISK